MLEQMRRQGASTLVYLIFGVLVVIFVINIGPQSGRGGCSGSDNSIISVNNEETTHAAYQIAYQANQAGGKQKTWVALEMLIRREILAQEADSRGLVTTDTAVQEEIKKGWFFLAGQRMKIPQIFDANGIWNLNAFHGWISNLNVSRNTYVDEQQRSMLAWMMSQILRDSVVVSREEALNQFLFEGNTATYDVVAFKPETYRSALKITDADVDRFLATHQAEVEARYKQDERLYKAVKPQLFLRQIFIAKPAAAGSAAAAPDDGKATLEAARAAIGTSKEKFAEKAKTLNSEEAMKNAAGELGWRTVENPMLGDKALTDAVKTLKPGEMTPVITTDRGSYLIMAEDKREGDLSFDQVKREIAKELARDTWGKEAAKRAAIAALEGARTGVGANLDQLYEKEPEAPGNNIQQLFQKIQNDPTLTPEQKQQQMQQLLQMLQSQGAPGGESGMIEVESKDIPAGWYADANGAGGGSATGSASGSAVAAGSGSAAAPAPAPAPAADDANTPSKDQLPAMAEVEKPHVQRFGPVPRATQMPGLGNSKAAQDAVFDELEVGRIGNKVYEANGDFIILQLEGRQKPNIADFDKDADRRVADLRDQRAGAFLEGWLKERCERLAKDGKLRANPELIAEHDDQGRLLPTQYRPCISFH